MFLPDRYVKVNARVVAQKINTVIVVKYVAQLIRRQICNPISVVSGRNPD